MNKQQWFVATPISSFSSPEEYCDFRTWLMTALDALRQNPATAQVYCTAERVQSLQNNDAPEAATRLDLDALVASTHFLLIYPHKVASSVLIELGYALALQKNILIFCRSRDDLPFSAQRLDAIFPFVSIHIVDILGEHAIQLLRNATGQSEMHSR